MKIHVGCCGWSYLQPARIGERPDWRRRYPHKLALYASHFELVEVNSTFYRLPQLKTAEHWLKLSREANPSFEFTVKVNRAITHLDRFSTDRSFEAYEAIKKIAAALEAKILLFQTPPSFRPTSKNLDRLRHFFQKVERGSFTVVFEPRGWKNEELAPLLKDLDLIHGVDPFARLPLTAGLAYLRLHGSPPGKRMYRYDYTREDLLDLAGSIASFKAEEIYVLFNNDHMYENALAFKEILQGGRVPSCDRVR